MASATFALETAVLDALCRENGLALSELYDGESDAFKTDSTVPILSPSEAREGASNGVDSGFKQIKIKTGTDLDTDIARVEAVRDAATDAELKIDANQGGLRERLVDSSQQSNHSASI
jgi:L-alanine-DL-glutamate epimerase-like enolase superfamily enzyme